MVSEMTFNCLYGTKPSYESVVTWYRKSLVYELKSAVWFVLQFHILQEMRKILDMSLKITTVKTLV